MEKRKQIITSREFITRHRNQGHIVDASDVGLPVCWSCFLAYCNGRSLAFEPDEIADGVEAR